jgi:uncharacterized protein
MSHPHRELPEIIQLLRSLYREVDKEIKRLLGLHRTPLQCRPGCAECCMDGISVNAVEAENIRYFCGSLLREKAPHPEGTCAFLDSENQCRIYEHRPYVCRTQGLPLHWLEDREGTTIAMRDICPINDRGTPIEQLPETHCWKIGWAEEELAKLQYAFKKELTARVALRSLFKP